MSAPAPDLWSAVEPHLTGQEKVLWTGRPGSGRLLTAADAFLIPFSVLWLAFAIFWEASVLAEGAGPFFVLWGVPFVLLGLYLTVGRFFYKRYRRQRTVYAVTDERVLSIYRGRFGNSVASAFVRNLPAIGQRLRSDGSGTVFFGNAPPLYASYADSGLDFFGSFAGPTPVIFSEIADARAVVELVSSLRSERY